MKILKKIIIISLLTLICNLCYSQVPNLVSNGDFSESCGTGVNSTPITLAMLKNQVLSTAGLRHGYYSLRLTVNNEVHYLKILKQ